MQAVDVVDVLTQLASTKGGGGYWKTSIIDLLKLLDLDSSLTAARKSLGQELNVRAGADRRISRAEHRSAKSLDYKLAENGGKVPDSLPN